MLFFVLKNKCSQIKLSNRCWRTRTLWMQISRFLSISLQLPMWGRDSCFSSHILWAARIPIPSLTKTKENGQLSEQFTMTCCHYHFHEQRSVLFQLAFEKNDWDGCPLKKKVAQDKKLGCSLHSSLVHVDNASCRFTVGTKSLWSVVFIAYSEFICI